MMLNFEEQLEKYAELIVKVGVNVKENQTVVLSINTEQVALARLITKYAYQAGAKEVIVKWSDDVINRLFIEQASDLETIQPSFILENEELLKAKASWINVVSSNPAALLGVDSQRIKRRQQALGKALESKRHATQNNDVSWTVVAAASSEWGQAVFPDDDLSTATNKLWQAIFTSTRVDQADPLIAWQAHDDFLAKQAKKLNTYQFDALHYKSPGTDLTIGLPQGHLWEGAGAINRQGEHFMPNMPTEEVFTAPDFRRVDGYITSTKPLSYAGVIIDKMKFTFKDGAIVDCSAEHGEAVLRDLISTDEGSKYLGEVALVPDKSPISQSGITFFNTLFDENASNHLAIGSAYSFSIKGGTKMTDQELAARGLNRSQVHV
ncbi:MAG: aminopeptidase, partial [Streptococcaceae bacterium]|nr:aminopeptidase [Streptococcaceae bacterium]